MRSLPGGAGALPAHAGMALAAEGGLSIKVNDGRNLWGAFGDVFHILGRFSVAPVEADAIDAKE